MGWEEASGNLRAPEQYTGEGRGRDQVWRKFRPPDGGGGGWWWWKWGLDFLNRGEPSCGKSSVMN